MLRALIFAIFIIACTPRFRNEKIASIRLKDFVIKSTSLKTFEDRHKIIAYLHGNMMHDVINMKKEAFLKKFIKTGIELLKFEIFETSTENENTVLISYRVTYRDPSQKQDTVVEAEKVAEMTFVEDLWKISMIYDISTTYSFSDKEIKQQSGSVF